MSSVAKVIELSAESDKSFDDAVKVGVERASKSIRNIKSVWVNEMHADVRDGKITDYRVNLRVTFVLDDTTGAG